MEVNNGNDGGDRPPKMKSRTRKRRETKKCSVVPPAEQVAEVYNMLEKRRRTPGSILFRLEDKFQDEGYEQILEVVMDLKNGPIYEEVKSAEKLGFGAEGAIAHVEDVIQDLKEKKPEIFKGHGHDEDFVEEIIALALLHEHDSKQAVKVFVYQKVKRYLKEYCNDYILNFNLEGLPQKEVLGIERERVYLIHEMGSKNDVKRHIVSRLSESQDWLKLYEFFIGECSVSKNSLGKDRMKNIMESAIKSGGDEYIEAIWQMIQSEKTPTKVACGVSNRVKRAACIAGLVVGATGLAYGGYHGYKNFSDTDEELEKPVPVAGENKAPKKEEPVQVIKNEVLPVNIKPPTKIVSGVMNVRNIDKQPQAKPNKVVSGTINIKPKQEVQKAPEKPNMVGLVKIDKKSLEKLSEGDYKNMYEGKEFSISEIRGKSITGMIEKRLMKLARGKKERKAYRKNLRKLEKGWLIYMRQLELRVKAQIANGESVNERDMADYHYWEMYKINHRGNYENAKRYEKRYRKLARKKKSKNFKRYQGYLDMGTSLMEGLRTLNPKIPSVNDVPSWSMVKLSNEDGLVLEYLRDTSLKMGLPVPTEAVELIAEKPKAPTKAPEICKVEKEKPKAQPMVSGVIESDVQLRSSDLNSYHAVSALEDVIFGGQSVQPANDNDGLFPWEREDVYKPAKQEEICIDAGEWLDDDNEVQTFADTGAFTVESEVKDEEDLYTEYKVQEQVEIVMDDIVDDEMQTFADAGAFTVEANSLPEDELYEEFTVQKQVEIDASNWANDNDDTQMLASTGAFNQTAKVDAIPEEDLYTEYKVEKKPKKKKKGFFGRAFGKVKNLFKKAA